MPNPTFESFGLNGLLLSPPAPMERVHHHHEVEINYLFRGEVTYLHRGEKRQVKPDHINVFWGTPPHSLVAAEKDAEMAWITIPLGWVLAWKLPNEFMRALLNGHWLESAVAGAHYPVKDWVTEIAETKEKAPAALLLELRACMLRLATEVVVAPKKQSVHFEAAQPIEAMTRFMGEKYSEPIGVREVAHAAGLQPKYAMTAFRRACGVTIHDYLLQHRLAHAQQLLIMTDDKIIDVALASGFGSASAFYAAFVSATKRTPLSFRNEYLRYGQAGGTFKEVKGSWGKTL